MAKPKANKVEKEDHQSSFSLDLSGKDHDLEVHSYTAFHGSVSPLGHYPDFKPIISSLV